MTHDGIAAKRDPLLQPFKLKSLELRNRVMSTSHACGLHEDGMPGERYQAYHEEKAIGGLALTMFGGSSNIAPDSPSVFEQLYVGDDRITDDDVRKLANKFEYTTDRDRDLATAPDFRAFYGCGTDTREVHSLLPDQSPRPRSISAAYTIARKYYGRPKERIERHIDKFINHLDTKSFRKLDNAPNGNG